LAPAIPSASSEAVPDVQLKRISPKRAASAKVPAEAFAPHALAQATTFSLALPYLRRFSARYGARAPGETGDQEGHEDESRRFQRESSLRAG
jgi:hypothetical protein